MNRSQLIQDMNGTSQVPYKELVHRKIAYFLKIKEMLHLNNNEVLSLKLESKHEHYSKFISGIYGI